MEISAAEFRSKCFKILNQVETRHSEFIITKRGKPIARIVHINEEKSSDPLLGALAGLGRTTGNLSAPLVDSKDWEID